MTERWFERSVLVTVGTGGVGKTTLAAAIALEAAARGRRTLVLTIDPARRLANALGLTELGHEPAEIPVDTILQVHGAAAPTAERSASCAPLFAMMLDTQRTFDELVERFAPDAETRGRILRSPIYQRLTDALSGTREYSAMEKLHQLHDAKDYDLIVLDTPPATHALQFLEAPRRLVGFLDGGFLKLMLHPAAAIGRTSLRWFQYGSRLALKALERITGLGFFADLSEFLLAFEGLLAGFEQRAREVGRLLRSPACGFVLVAAPDPEQVRRTMAFWERLQAERVPLVGLILNRVLMWPIPAATEVEEAGFEEAGFEEEDFEEEDWEEARGWLDRHMDAEAAAAALGTLRRHALRAQRDAGLSAQLERALPLPSEAMIRVPLLSSDVHSIEGLGVLCASLFARRPPHG